MSFKRKKIVHMMVCALLLCKMRGTLTLVINVQIAATFGIRRGTKASRLYTGYSDEWVGTRMSRIVTAHGQVWPTEKTYRSSKQCIDSSLEHVQG